MWRASLSTLGTTESYAFEPDAESGRQVRLDSNENLFVPRALVRQISEEVAGRLDLRLYPSRSQAGELAAAVSRYVGVREENIVPDNGSDALIDKILMAFFRKGGKLAIVEPTFQMYRIRASVLGIPCVSVPLSGEFELDLDCLIRRSKEASVVFLCRPNNPTGSVYARSEVEEVLERTESAVVLDEAYIEFADDAGFSELARNTDRLLVMRSFSKAFGAAGLRLGYLVAQRKVASIVTEKLQHPYNLSSFACEVGRGLLSEIYTYRRIWDDVRIARTKFADALGCIPGVTPFRSGGNFVMVSLRSSATRVRRLLAERGFLIRSFSKSLSPRYPNMARITVPPPRIMGRFLSELRRVMKHE